MAAVPISTTAGFLLWASDCHHAEPEALTIYRSLSTSVEEQGQTVEAIVEFMENHGNDA